MQNTLKRLSWLYLFLAAACGPATEQSREATVEPTAAAAPPTLDEVAEQYVKLALALRPHDGAYVDAYFGPAEWAAEAEAEPRSLDELRGATSDLAARLASIDEAGLTEIERLRRSVLEKRLTSMLSRMDMAEGRYLPFDEESAVLFDAVAPDHDTAYFQGVLERIDALLPGEGPLNERLDAFRRELEIPDDRLAAVFDAAIEECRRRTLEHIELPEGESFTIEYVTDQPWSGYNWYRGDYFSLIQINTDQPIFIDRAVDLGCHEGYPGHHTYNALVEAELVDARGWVEFTVNPLYGPQSLISEGSANYGIELAFPNEERRRFEKEVLYPLAGLDVELADRYDALLDALTELDYADNEAARDYLNGAASGEETIVWLTENALSTRERAEQRLRFIETYRSYVINYNLGRDLVAAYVEEQGGTDTARQWAAFERLLSQPMSPGEMR